MRPWISGLVALVLAIALAVIMVSMWRVDGNVASVLDALDGFDRTQEVIISMGQLSVTFWYCGPNDTLRSKTVSATQGATESNDAFVARHDALVSAAQSGLTLKDPPG